MKRKKQNNPHDEVKCGDNKETVVRFFEYSAQKQRQTDAQENHKQRYHDEDNHPRHQRRDDRACSLQGFEFGQFYRRFAVCFETFKQ